MRLRSFLLMFHAFGNPMERSECHFMDLSVVAMNTTQIHFYWTWKVSSWQGNNLTLTLSHYDSLWDFYSLTQTTGTRQKRWIKSGRKRINRQTKSKPVVLECTSGWMQSYGLQDGEWTGILCSWNNSSNM